MYSDGQTVNPGGTIVNLPRVRGQTMMPWARMGETAHLKDEANNYGSYVKPA